MPSTVVLPPRARFSAVEEVVIRCGLGCYQFEPQVFPERPEPSRVAWCTSDGASTLVFRYAVNPDRRMLYFTGPDAGDLRRAVVTALGEVKPEMLVRELRDADDEALAFRSAFLLAECLGEDSATLLLTSAETRPEHSAWGSLRAFEPFALPGHVVRLRALRANADRPVSVRALAGEIASQIALV